MTRSETFASHYINLDKGVGGDGNVRSFNSAMDPETNVRDAVRAFNNADGVILVPGPGKKIRIIHGLIDFGNNMSRPTSKVCGHIGMGETAFGGHIDYVKALSNIQFDTPMEREFQDATTKEALDGLQRPGATSKGGTYDGTKAFFLIPTAQRAVMKCQSTCPLNIILAGTRSRYRTHRFIGSRGCSTH